MRSAIGGYRVVKRIGSGGMSTVYHAIDADERDVALKLLHPELAAEPSARERLRREVRMLQRVHGPYVAQILDAETEDEEVFIVTQLIDGPTLDSDVRTNGRYVGSDLVELGEELAAALRSIHDVGVLHRDLKPSNVMMGADGPVLIDFGIAQLGDDLRMTQTGSLTHTPGFADPRVIRGGDPDETADWWALAAVLAFAATGEEPFGVGNSPAVMHRAIMGEARLPGLEGAVEEAFRSALAPDAARRISFDKLVKVIADPERAGFGSAHLGSAAPAGADLGGAVEGGEATRPIVLGGEGSDSDWPSQSTRWPSQTTSQTDEGEDTGTATLPIAHAGEGGDCGTATMRIAMDPTERQRHPEPVTEFGAAESSGAFGTEASVGSRIEIPSGRGAPGSYAPPGEHLPESFDPHEPITGQLASSGQAHTSAFDGDESATGQLAGSVQAHSFDLGEPGTRQIADKGAGQSVDPVRTSVFARTDLPVASPGAAADVGAWQIPHSAVSPYEPGRLPHWLRPPRKARLHVLLLGVIVTIFAAAWPVHAAAAFSSVVVIVSLVGGADRELRNRRIANGGPDKGDVVRTVLCLPLTLIVAIFRSAVTLGVGGGAGWLTAWMLDALYTTTDSANSAIGVAAGMIVAWFIGTNSDGRHGARRIMEGLAPTAGYRLFWLAILLVVAMAALVVVTQTGIQVI